MENTDTLKAMIKEYRRQARDAADDVNKGQNQLFDYERKLESLQNYQAECQQGFSSIPDSPFFYAQRRECKLLLDHLDEVLHEQSECVRSCLKYIEIKTGQKKKLKERLKQCEEQLEELLLEGEDFGAKKPVMQEVAKSDKDDAYAWIKVGK